MDNKADWNEKVGNLLKSELAKKGISYIDLVELLNGIGIKETYNGIASKISRGTFSFAFFLQCMEAIKTKEMRF
jgi:hypothetical protein